ncbi:putative galactosyl transferase [Diplodia seriata]|uniref:Putative galactosyl transferase n=1 Tax=Diplodia seriata TaxID=420778 RepID=A0A0G2EWM7_9PEZI|nr:putative galactosyl transferase [Diplodia seriata]
MAGRVLTPMALLPFLALLLPSLVTAKCECGYSVNKTSDESHMVWTDMMETDFLHIDDLSNRTDSLGHGMNNIGWVPQAYNVSAEDARGQRGKMAQVENVVANPLMDKSEWAGQALSPGDAGLQLIVRSTLVDNMVPFGELVSTRTDMRYGSFRVQMKMSWVPGTCGAFFMLHNNTQEIDFEFLSKQYNSSSSPVNLVLHSPESAAAGFDASKLLDNFKVHPLPFRPDAGFHEYRFDWLPDRVSFYADGNWLWDMVDNVPNSGGHLVLNHWSNADPNWSAGPPEQDSIMTVSYVKAYFNSSDSQRQHDYFSRCPDDTKLKDGKNVCVITEPEKEENDNTSKTDFFSSDPKNRKNQTVFDDWPSSGGRMTPGGAAWAAGVAFALVMAVVGFP